MIPAEPNYFRQNGPTVVLFSEDTPNIFKRHDGLKRVSKEQNPTEKLTFHGRDEGGEGEGGS
jgi:hypothetical protein